MNQQLERLTQDIKSYGNDFHSVEHMQAVEQKELDRQARISESNKSYLRAEANRYCPTRDNY